MRVENNFINTFDNFTKQSKSPSQAPKVNHVSLDKLELSPISLEVKYGNGSMQNHMAMHEALQNKLQTGTIYEKLFGGSGSNLNEFVAQNPIISRGGMAYKLRFDDENGVVYDERLVKLLSSKYTNDDDFKKAYLDIKNDIEEEVELSIEIDRRIMEENDIALANDYNKGLSVRDLAKLHGIQTFDELTKDIEKIDGVYDPSDMQRAYLGVSEANRPKLRARLESEFMKGMLFYGMSQKEQEEWITNGKNTNMEELVKTINSLHPAFFNTKDDKKALFKLEALEQNKTANNIYNLAFTKKDMKILEFLKQNEIKGVKFSTDNGEFGDTSVPKFYLASAAKNSSIKLGDVFCGSGGIIDRLMDLFALDDFEKFKAGYLELKKEADAWIEQNDFANELKDVENPTKDEGIKRKAIEGKSEKRDEKLYTFENDLLLQKLKEREILSSLRSIDLNSKYGK